MITIMQNMEQTMEDTIMAIMVTMEEIQGSMHFTVSIMILAMEEEIEMARNELAREALILSKISRRAGTVAGAPGW